MPIPDFNANGLLPPGVHACTLEEVQQRFGLFRRTSQRPALFAKLVEYVKEAQSAKLVRAIILDGSFVTAKETPNDIDMIVVLPEDYDGAVIRRPFEYNAISKRYLQRRFGFDVVVARESTERYLEAVTFFQKLRERDDIQKGVLRIEL